MKRSAVLAATLSAGVLLALVGAAGRAATFPHADYCGIDCYACHDLLSGSPTYLPPWTIHVPQHIDDTAYNTLCWSCHNDVIAPFATTHSSRATSEAYGDADEDGEEGWSFECIDCHDPHRQAQALAYGAAAAVAEGTSTALGAETLSCAGAGWSENAFAGMLLIPNAQVRAQSYRILGNTEETLQVAGPIDLTQAAAGDAFEVVYGRLVRAQIRPPGGEAHAVRLFRREGSHSFADGDGVLDGVCEVCHTLTRHFRCTGDAPDQNHEGLGSLAGGDCTGCHGHAAGFAHGTGSGAPGCEGCHGHDDGYGGGSYAGSTQSHSTHTDHDADDARGPSLTCADCHDTARFPFFASGEDADGDGRYELEETDVCDACHSPGGTYDGVGGDEIGAKANWDEGVYEGTVLRAGKERWCAGCHDESPSTVLGVPAPNVVGEEDEAATYGIGRGYYTTGHGLPPSAAYPASGGITAGAGIGCVECHDAALGHVDGSTRTYDDANSPSTPPSLYRAGYRLRSVDGEEPLLVPLNAGNSAANFRLCARCHATGPFLSASDMATNFTNGSTNLHEYHLAMTTLRFSADWDFSVFTSRISCVTCHNVHGSDRPAMLRDGRLVGRTPGLQYWYYNAAISYTGSVPPQPENVPLAASDGVVWHQGTAANLCSTCHGGALIVKSRVPWEPTAQAPSLSWTGESGYESDGAHPDAAFGGGRVFFRVRYADTNNDAPRPVELWLDENDDGLYAEGEKHALGGIEGTDTIFTNGKLYGLEIAVPRTADGTVTYRFRASDGALEATGEATAERTIAVSNSPPTLAWTGEPSYEGDGVDPDRGGSGATYRFRVEYRDADGDAPATIRLLLDANDDGLLDEGESVPLAVAPGGDGDHANGEVYAADLTLAHAGDGRLPFTFAAGDGFADATGAPTGTSELVVGVTGNAPPFLTWAAASCRPEGVKPPLGATGADYEFAVRYTDPDGQCPALPGGIQLTVGGVAYDLAPLDADEDCADGRDYGVTVSLAAAGAYPYSFSASDGSEAAWGEPALEHTVSVVEALKVRPAGGAGWYSTIQAAANAVVDDVTILVYEGTYTGRLYLRGNDDRTVIRAVCGPETTILDGTGTNAVQFDSANAGSVIDGFQITKALVGVFVNGASPTIANCRIHGNVNTNATSQGGGFYVTSSSTLTVTGCEVFDNVAGSGAGFYLNTGTGHAISDTVIRGNTAAGSGGAVWVNTAATFTDVEIRDNTVSDPAAATYGGGVFANTAANLTFRRCVISGNSAPSPANRGGALYAAGTVSLENCVVAGNSGAQGGAAWVNGGTLTLTNATVADNVAHTGWGGAFYRMTGSLTVRNSVLWGNASTSLHQGHVAYGLGSITVQDSLIENDDDGNYADYPYFHGAAPTLGGAAVGGDPLFVDPAAGDYHLRANSPAIDRANAAYAPLDDLDGDARPLGAADLGADEYAP